MTRYFVTDPSPALLARLGGVPEFEDTQPFDLALSEELAAKRGDPVNPVEAPEPAPEATVAEEIIPDPDGAVFVENGEAIPGAESPIFAP